MSKQKRIQLGRELLQNFSADFATNSLNNHEVETSSKSVNEKFKKQILESLVMEDLKRVESNLAYFKANKDSLKLMCKIHNLTPKDFTKTSLLVPSTNGDICKGNDSSKTDPKVCCSMCGVNVHKLGYEKSLSSLSPEKLSSWIGDRCEYIINNKVADFGSISGFLCKTTRGALVEVQDSKWVHIECVYWHPKLYFEDDHLKNKILGVFSYKAMTNDQRQGVYCTQQGIALQSGDIKHGSKLFGIRGASGIRRIIKSSSEMEQQRQPENQEDGFIFGEYHQVDGIKYIKQKKFELLKVSNQSEKILKMLRKQKRLLIIDLVLKRQ